MPDAAARRGGGIIAAALVVVAALAVVAGSITPAAATGANSTAAVTLAPVRPPSATDRDRAYLVHTVTPGQTISDAVAATNLTGSPLPVLLNTVDAGINQSGQFAPAADGVHTATGGWLTAGLSAATIAAHGSVRVPITIHVPNDATTGDHLGAVTVEAQSPVPAGAGIGVRLRVAVRVYLTVTGAGLAAPTFAIRSLSFTGTGNSPSLAVTVAATGPRIVEPLGSLRVTHGALDDSLSLPVLGSVPGGAERRFSITLPGPLGAGRYTAVLHLRLLTGSATADASTQFDIGSLATPATVPRSKTSRPWLMMLAPLALLSLWALTARRRRNGGSRKRGRHLASA